MILITPSLFRLSPYKPRFHYDILSTTRYCIPRMKAPFTDNDNENTTSTQLCLSCLVEKQDVADLCASATVGRSFRRWLLTRNGFLE